MTWQDLVSLGVVLAALVYVVRHLLLVGTRKKPTGCGTCADCPAAKQKGSELLFLAGRHLPRRASATGK